MLRHLIITVGLLASCTSFGFGITSAESPFAVLKQFFQVRLSTKTVEKVGSLCTLNDYFTRLDESEFATTEDYNKFLALRARVNALAAHSMWSENNIENTVADKWGKAFGTKTRACYLPNKLHAEFVKKSVDSFNNLGPKRRLAIRSEHSKTFGSISRVDSIRKNDDGAAGKNKHRHGKCRSTVEPPEWFEKINAELAEKEIKRIAADVERVYPKPLPPQG